MKVRGVLVDRRRDETGRGNAVLDGATLKEPLAYFHSLSTS
jgi:hypothetical protein